MTNLLPVVTAVAREAGARLLAIYSPDARPSGRDDMFAAAHRNEDAASQGLRAALSSVRPEARWISDDDETRPLPDDGEWWVVDAVEGNVNHVHGLPEWCVSITLLRAFDPVLTVVHQPVGDHTWTAERGGGAFLDGRPLHASAKTSLDAAITVTGQAEAAQTGTYHRLGDSITAMLAEALMVKATVPSTFPMLLVASGQNDVFWQFAPVIPGVAAGALLITEAGGVVTRVDGSPWRPGDPDILATAPALHKPAVAVLA
ncbi:inositol monophosphatase family protein [Actinoplanes sp. NPDC051343]|uniref:inositol monophosphatase family protein n=1 Tax=Actinoplanes sp. NPDC051343 TaxID=3363906 RepID=UPI003794968A